ncbi:MAG: hypothetical protein BV459_01365 [Thermoplasmata archaeon M11B2D]|nr:MAG: hypothetical protein BV459_01365 [Thermoplasmata archaeon M11B2D]PNX53560.1 MAG: hypothetical protein BV458_03785 [Thermoplasmata archaeon M9B2D]
MLRLENRRVSPQMIFFSSNFLMVLPTFYEENPQSFAIVSMVLFEYFLHSKRTAISSVLDCLSFVFNILFIIDFLDKHFHLRIRKKSRRRLKKK